MYKFKILSFILLLICFTTAFSKDKDDKINGEKLADTIVMDKSKEAPPIKKVHKVGGTKVTDEATKKAMAAYKAKKKEFEARFAGSKAKSLAAPKTLSPDQYPELNKDFNIMKQLPGLDPCFGAVEFFRDEGDVTNYKSFGDAILLDKSYKLDNSHKTYIGIAAGMIRDKKSIPEIRQKLLDTCRLLIKAK